MAAAMPPGSRIRFLARFQNDASASLDSARVLGNIASTSFVGILVKVAKNVSGIYLVLTIGVVAITETDHHTSFFITTWESERPA
jgi:hypothetical protein